MKMQILLECIGSTEDSSFGELCDALDEQGECPAKGDKAAWSELFRLIIDAERAGFVEVERTQGRRLDSIRVTQDGVAELKRLRGC